MPGLELISLAEAAERLGGVSVKTVKRRCVEAGIRGPRPGREMMLTEQDYARLVEYIARHRRRTRLGRPSRSPKEALRGQSGKRLRKGAAERHILGRGRRKVISPDLERSGK